MVGRHVPTPSEQTVADAAAAFSPSRAWKALQRRDETLNHLGRPAAREAAAGNPGA